MANCFTCGGKFDGLEKFKCNFFDCHAFMHKNCCSIYKPNKNTWFSYCSYHYAKNFGKTEDDNISNSSAVMNFKRKANSKNTLNVKEDEMRAFTPINEISSSNTLRNENNNYTNGLETKKPENLEEERKKPDRDHNVDSNDSEDQDELLFEDCNKDIVNPNKTFLGQVFDLFKSKPKDNVQSVELNKTKFHNFERNIHALCFRCSSSVRNPYKCRYCFISVHRECINVIKSNSSRDKDDEGWSIQPSKKLFTCKCCSPRNKFQGNHENMLNEERLNIDSQNEMIYNYPFHYQPTSHIGVRSMDRNFPSVTMPHNPLNNNMNKFSFPNRTASNYDYFYTQRMVYKKLPIVTDTEQTWRLFFQSYINSKDYFDDAGNIIRIMNAIKCEEIKEIGGLNLFEQGFYHQTILEINARVSGSDKMVIKLYQEIKRLRKPENYDFENILKSIDKIRNFFNLIWKEKRVGYLYDTNLCIDLMQKLPDRAYNRLTSLMLDAKRMNREFYIQDIMPEIYKLTEETRSKIEMKTISERHYTKNVINDYFYANSLQEEEVRSDEGKEVNAAQVFKFNKCFLPNHGGHRPNECEKLWSISGAEAKKLGLEYKRCIVCGLAAHASKMCPYSKKLICRQKGCTENHYRLYCEKRPSRNNEKGTFVTEMNVELENYFADCNKILPEESYDSSSESDEVSNSNKNNRKDIKLTNRDFFFSKLRSTPSDGDTKVCVSRNCNNISKEATTLEAKKPWMLILRKFFIITVWLLIITFKKLKRNSEKLYTHTIRSIFSLQTVFNLSAFQKKSSKNILPTVRVAVITPFGIKYGVFMLDSGSTTSLIKSEFANKLKAKGIESSITINGINSKKKNEDSRIIKLKLARIDDTINFTYVAFHTFDDLKIGNQIFVASEFYNKYKNLRHLELQDFDGVDGLIGIDNVHIFDWTVVKNAKTENYHPLGIRTAIGDCIMHCDEQLIKIYDKCTDGIAEQDHFLHVKTISSTYAIIDLENKISEDLNEDDVETEFNKIEELIHLQTSSQFLIDSRENYFEYLANETLKRETKLLPDSKHFQAPILWKDKESLFMPTEASYKNALKRFLIIEKYGKKKNEFHEYEKEVQNLIDKKYAIRMNSQQIMAHTRFSYYVATFFIKPENKRRRMIFDFKSKVNGVSYNSNVIGNLNLLNRIDVILSKARTGKYMIKGDIGEMFHQIYLTEEDAESMRFLFRFSNEKEIQHYKLKVLPFGCASSPTISQFVKNKIAESVKTINPLVHESLFYNTYMDDTIQSLSCKETIVKLTKDLKQILKENGFNMLKINSNNKNINDQLKTLLNEYEEEKLFSQESKERLLGYEFNLETDCISPTFTIESLPTNVRNNLEWPSKRNVLQVMNSLFDPLGLFGYITAKMKILYKRVCDNHKKWDDKINADLISQWFICLEYYNQAKNINISRWIYPIEFDRIKLLIFCDASTEMTCAVAYLHLLCLKKNESHLSLICSRSHTINNRRKYTIPELELEAAFQAVKLMIYLRKIGFENYEECLYFTDSHIVLDEITITKPEKFSVYTYNRIKFIHAYTKKENWYWIPSNYQPADFGTKIEVQIDNNSDNYWFKPKLLELSQNEWLKFNKNQSQSFTMIQEEKLNKDVTSLNEYVSLNKFKNFQHLINTTMIILKYKYRKDSEINVLKKELKKLDQNTDKDKQHIQNLTKMVIEIEQYLKNENHWFDIAETHWIRRAQEEDEDMRIIIKRLKSNKCIPKNNKYQKLLLFLDDFNVLRLKTRISNEIIEKFSLNYDKAFPIVLPQNNVITKLIILQTHRNVGHVLLKSCCNKLRMRFYIKSIEKEVKRVINNDCHYCHRNDKKTNQPLMGDIPIYAFAFKESCFTKIVCDVFGPIETKPSKYSKTRVKRWVLVGICLASRGVHLEILENQTTEAYFRAFECMFCVRGRPKVIITDQFSSFTATNKTLKEIGKICNDKFLEEGVISKPIEWIIKSAHMPWQQGVVERQIQEIKKLLKNFEETLNTKSNFLERDLRYFLMKITNILNNSPINKYEEGHVIPQLTPNHFLMMRENSQCLPAQGIYTKDLGLNWQEHQKLINIFWNRWLDTFFNKLLIREKWTEHVDPLKVGSIVLTADKNYTDQWRIGRILSIDIGSNQQVRSVKIMLGKNKKIKNYKKLSAGQLLKVYKKEKNKIVSRPAACITELKIIPRDITHLLKNHEK